MFWEEQELKKEGESGQEPKKEPPKTNSFFPQEESGDDESSCECMANIVVSGTKKRPGSAENEIFVDDLWSGNIWLNANIRLIGKNCPEEFKSRCKWELEPKDGHDLKLLGSPRYDRCDIFLHRPFSVPSEGSKYKKITLNVKVLVDWHTTSEEFKSGECQGSVTFIYYPCFYTTVKESEKKCEELKKEFQSILDKLSESEVAKIYESGVQATYSKMEEIEQLPDPDTMSQVWRDLEWVCKQFYQTIAESYSFSTTEALLGLIPTGNSPLKILIEKLITTVITETSKGVIGDPYEVYQEAIKKLKELINKYAKEYICDVISKLQEAANYVPQQMRDLRSMLDKDISKYRQDLDDLAKQASSIPCIECDLRISDDIDERIIKLREKIKRYLTLLDFARKMIRSAALEKLKRNPKSTKFCRAMSPVEIEGRMRPVDPCDALHSIK